MAPALRAARCELSPGGSGHGSAALALAGLVRTGRVRRLAVESVNAAFVLGTPLGAALKAAGFGETPKGVRLDARG